jgi:hypothetical protein
MKFSQKLTAVAFVVALSASPALMSIDVNINHDVKKTEVPHSQQQPYCVRKPANMAAAGYGLLLGHALLDLIPYTQKHAKEVAEYWAKSNSPWKSSGPVLDLPNYASLTILREIACVGFLAGAGALFAYNAFTKEKAPQAEIDSLTQEDIDSIGTSKTLSYFGLLTTIALIWRANTVHC